MQKKKGISLVVLIITIIITIILSGAVILTLSDSAIINRANEAVDSVEIRNEKEMLQTLISTAQRNNLFGILTVEDFQSVVDKSKLDITVMDNGDTIVAKFNEANRYYEIKANGNILGQMQIVADATPGAFDGTGTQDDPFVIMSIEDLVYFSKEVTTNKNTFSGKYVILGRDLNFNSELSYVDVNTTEYDEYLGGDGTTGIREQLTNGNGFVAIGKKSPWLPFSGIFDGKNKVISNLYINNSTAANVGLFGYVNGATIENLEITGQIISNVASAVIGGIMAYSGNTLITNCANKIDIVDTATTGGYIGGIVGRGEGGNIISNCENKGKITTQQSTVAGIINWYAQSITNCHNTATLTSGGGYCGGIIGYANYAKFTISNCTNTGLITSTNKAAAGIGAYLILSGTSTIIESCLNEGAINGKNGVGGIIGERIGSGELIVKNCVNAGAIAATSLYGGGIGGNVAGGSIISCYNKASVNGGGQIGGIIGAGGYRGNVSLTNCWNEGTITGTGNVNNICAYVQEGILTVNNCYNIADKYDYGFITENRAGTLNVYNSYIADRNNTGWNCLVAGGWSDPKVNIYKLFYKEATYRVLGAGTVTGTPTEYTDTYMKSQAFVDELNANISNGWEYEVENDDGTTETVKVDRTGWAKWVYNANSYPKLDITTTWNGTAWVSE